LVGLADPLNLARVTIQSDGTFILVFMGDNEPIAVLLLIDQRRAVVGKRELVLADFLERVHVKGDHAGKLFRPLNSSPS
jgi:hypothetical protein